MNAWTFESRGRMARGYLHLPQGDSPAPAIVLCHGFTGDCREHGLFEDFAQAAAKAGLIAARIDCIGSGSSEGSFAEDTSLSGWRADLRAAMDALQAEEACDGRFITMGISMGAAAALLAATDPRVQACVGWAPVVEPEQVFRQICGAEAWRQMGEGQTVHCSYAGTSFDIAAGFRRDIERVDTGALLGAPGKPILLRFGREDPVIGRQTGAKIRDAGFSGVRVDIVAGEDHGCMQREEENIRETIAFLQDVLDMA